MSDEDNSIATQALEAGTGGFAQIPQLHFDVISGDDSGKRFSTTGDRMVIGTHKSADVQLSDRAISRFHIEVAIGDRAITVRDLGSRNGTKINGVSIVEAHLSNGDTISIGRLQLRAELGAGHSHVPLSKADRFGRLVGSSVPSRALFAVLERASQTDATVLLQGETGTGKDAAAESIHMESARSEQPLVVVDMGAIPGPLMESELFGHERGAFTGADRARTGAFEAAHTGTLFLDEIGELSLELQPKLLRALDRREFQRVGSTDKHPVDVRIIAATNRNLREEVNAGRFRADLYYRLAVLEIRVPTLLERLDDIPELVTRLLQDHRSVSEAEKDALLTESFLSELTRHSWPGNVRELRNYLERCLALGHATPLERVGGAMDPPMIDFDRSLAEVRDNWVRFLERKYLTELLRRHNNNVTATAKAAGMDRTSLYRVLTRCGLR